MDLITILATLDWIFIESHLPQNSSVTVKLSFTAKTIEFCLFHLQDIYRFDSNYTIGSISLGIQPNKKYDFFICGLPLTKQKIRGT